MDGHDFDAIHRAFEAIATPNGQPSAIVADTVKGKGVSFMEGNNQWHSGPTNPEQTERALAEICGQWLE